MLPVIIDGKNPNKFKDRLEMLLDLVGLKDRKNHKPEQLSGGEQQRVALARALITEPAIVLADEPTGNLDSKTGTIIMETLRRSCEQLGQTIIVVTHDSRAATFADRVVFLRDGLIETEIKYEPESEKTSRLRWVMETLENMGV